MTIIFLSQINLVSGLILLIAIISALIGLYMLSNFLFQNVRAFEAKKQDKIKHVFRVLIPAHNEENTIADTIESVLQSDYGQSHLEVYVIANNCNDKTASIAKRYPIKVFEVSSPFIKSKADAMEWAFENTDILRNREDVLYVLDADSLVEIDTFSQLNQYITDENVMVQSRCLPSKHNKSVLAQIMGIAFAVENRLWNVPHAKQGRSTLMRGTGCAIKVSHMLTIGWNISCITEDIEFSIQTILAGRKIYYAHEAIVYTEFSKSPIQLWRQLRRWFSGQWQVFFHYFPELIYSLTMDFHPNLLMAIVHNLTPLLAVLSLVNSILVPINAHFAPESPMPLSPGLMLTGFAFGYLLTCLFSLFVLIIDKQGLRGKIKAVLVFPVYSSLMPIVYLFSMLKPKTKWVAITHHGKQKI